MFPCTVLMLGFLSELGLDTRVATMDTIHMGIIPTAITGHIRTIMGLHTIGMVGTGTGATTVIITTIGINVV